MYLKLTTDNWDRLRFAITEKQKDYDYVEKDSVDVFIYGYPFDDSTASWISAGDVYQLYLRSELDFVKDIEGIYAIVILDRVREKCSVVIDRYGVYSLFYSKHPDYVILSDTIGEIIAHVQHIGLNQESIIEYLNFGFKLGNKTHIEGIHEFESSTVYQINKQLDISEEVYWQFLGKSEENRTTKEDFREVFNAHIMTAMSLEERISLPLTGGLDTRTILSACTNKKENLHCYTHGVKNASDVKLAQKICNHFNINHSFYELDEEWIKGIPSTLEKNAEILNGLVPSLSFMHVKRSYENEHKKGELFISGLMGNEIWRSLLAAKAVHCRDIDDVASRIVELHTRLPSNVINIFNDYSGKQLGSLLKESTKTELLKAQNADDPIALYVLFVFRNFCSNWASNSLKATGKHFKIFAALLHKDLVQQIPLMRLEEKTSGSIQKYIIARNNSYLATLPLDTGQAINRNLITNLRDRTRRMRLYFRWAVNTIYRKVFKSDIFTPPSYTNYPAWLRTYHKEFLLDILSYEKMVTKEFFDRQGLERVVTSFLSGDNSLSLFILRLISLEIWLKRVTK